MAIEAKAQSEHWVCNGGSEAGDAIARATNVVVPAVTETVQRWSTSAVQSLAYKNVCKRRSWSDPLYMNELSKDGAPASVGENVEKNHPRRKRSPSAQFAEWGHYRCDRGFYWHDFICHSPNPDLRRLGHSERRDLLAYSAL